MEIAKRPEHDWEIVLRTVGDIIVQHMKDPLIARAVNKALTAHIFAFMWKEIPRVLMEEPFAFKKILDPKPVQPSIVNRLL